MILRTSVYNKLNRHPINMQGLHLPPFDIKTKSQNEHIYIYDFLRKRYLRLTPEEWVRQHFTHYLVEHKKYPSALLANEVTINVNGVARRCDSVLYHKTGGMPRIIIEYKAPHISITQAVFQQIYSYNSVLRADYLIVSNGMTHYCCHINYIDQSVTYLREIPDYTDLK